jgi:hypothetical protein
MKVANDAHPCLVALCFQQDRISDFASEFAHARTDNALPKRCRRRLALPWSRILLGRIVCTCIVVDPFPGVVFVSKLVVGIFAEYSTTSEVLPCCIHP